MSTLLVLTGMSLEEIGYLDVLTFNALLASVIRVTYTHKTEAAWTAMAAAQGTQKGMQERVSRWSKIINRGREKKNDITAFLRDFGKGI